jgi:signal transduction histidine kinase
METSGEKILVVDDNSQFINLMRKVLESRGFLVSVALDGKTAIDRVLSEKPHLILLDLMLPDITGEEVLKRAKEIDKEVAVVVVTGFGGEQTAVDMMKKGAVDFLSKPIETEVLLASIKNALKIRNAQNEERGVDLYSSLEKFFPFLAHEIRNPLHAISGALAIIQRRSNLKDHLLSQSIKIINEEVQHLNEFVQECLNFVRPPNTVRFVGVKLDELISVVMNIITHMFEAESKKIAITTDIDPRLPPVYANYEEIKQVFLNVVKNAFEAMPEGGQLHIKAVRRTGASEYAEIIFTDSGAGIKRGDVDKLFEPFFTTKVRGTGLGLAICSRIITERHRGKIGVESNGVKGAIVKIELPIDGRSGG